jgi:hypothetical protein
MISDEEVPPTEPDAILAQREQARTDLESTEKVYIARTVIGALLMPGMYTFLVDDVICGALSRIILIRSTFIEKTHLAISSSMGWVLGRIPVVNKWFPVKIVRSMVGGCLFVLLKDSVHLFYRYQKLSVSKHRRIVNYLD